jgi:hypothetical protein
MSKKNVTKLKLLLTKPYLSQPSRLETFVKQQVAFCQAMVLWGNTIGYFSMQMSHSTFSYTLLSNGLHISHAFKCFIKTFR